jgi:WXG100 family type VII secretion target
MAKTAFTIQMDFAKAMRQADKLDEIAQNISQAGKTDLVDCMQKVGEDWKSDTSTAYQKKGKEVAEHLVKISNNLTKTAQAVRQIAKTTYEAEMTALELAKIRK